MRRMVRFTTLGVLATALAILVWEVLTHAPIRQWAATVVEDTRLLAGLLRLSEKEASAPTADGLEPAPVAHAQTKVVVAEEAEHKHSDDADKAGGRAPAETGDERHEESVKLTAAQLQEFEIELDVAGQGPIAVNLERPAEIRFDGDRLNHVGPRVDGVVSEVNVKQGQVVAADEVLGVLNSRELAELKATYLAALERRNLARETFERENRLWEKKISSEKDYLDAKASLAEAEIAVRAAGQKLHALGFPRGDVDSLTTSESTDLTRYEILAPIAGTVIERHLSLGEAVSADKEVFVIADATAVWIEVTIYPKDMSLVRAGQTVRIDVGDSDPIEGQISFVTPHLNEQTRTATARVAIDSANGRLKPGMFVMASIEVGQDNADVRIPKSAIQNFENGPVVFVQEGQEFEPRPVKLGRENALYVEVASGVNAGETYVSKGAFTLKAELEKASFGDGHNH